MRAYTFSFVLALCADSSKPAPFPVELSPTGDASQNTVQLRGFSCGQPQSSRVLFYRKACSVTDAVLTKGAKLQVIQHVPRFEIPAYKALMKLQCTAELVSADISEEKCYTALPVIRNGGKRAFMDVRKKLLQDIATEIPCAADTVIYFQDLLGVWRKKSKSLVVTIVDDRRLAAQDSNL